MEILMDKFNVRGVCMVMQALLSLYSYNATSGIIVDIGERMEILPIYDGEFIIVTYSVLIVYRVLIVFVSETTCKSSQ